MHFSRRVQISGPKLKLMDVGSCGLLFCDWIGIAAWQLAGLPGTDSTWLAVAGCVVVLAALGYRWYGMSKVARLAKLSSI